MKWLILVLALGMVGCVTAEQREEAIEKTATAAREATYKTTYEASIKAGMSEDAAKEAAVAAAKIIYEKTREEAEKRIPAAGGGAVGRALLGIFYALVQAAPMFLKGKTA